MVRFPAVTSMGTSGTVFTAGVILLGAVYVFTGIGETGLIAVAILLFALQAGRILLDSYDLGDRIPGR